MGADLSEETKARLITLLKKLSNIFAWKPIDITGVYRKVIEHNLNIISGSIPIKQKKEGKTGNGNKAINEEVSKLVGTGILRE